MVWRRRRCRDTDLDFFVLLMRGHALILRNGVADKQTPDRLATRFERITGIGRTVPCSGLWASRHRGRGGKGGYITKFFLRNAVHGRGCLERRQEANIEGAK
jgi:hypothetical protein